MKHYIKKRLCAAVVAANLVLLPTVTAFAQTSGSKDEVVYVNLTATGEVEDIYVVNSFTLADTAALLDYGNYTELKNLSTTQPLVAKNGAVTVDAPGMTAPDGRFYYQGRLADTDGLPWQVVVGYRLDGQTIAPEQLAGQSGRLEITLRLTTRTDADALYKGSFALQTSLSLDSGRCHNITAAGATIANAGENKQLSYVLLPGDSKSYTITADVTDFAYDGIQIAAVPFKMEIDRPDTGSFSDQLGDLKDGVSELDDGAAELDDGVVKLYDGVWELRDGAADLNDGVYQLLENLPELTDGTGQLAGGLNQMTGALEAQSAQLTEAAAALRPYLEQMTQNPQTAQLAYGLLAYMDGANSLTAGLNQGLTPLAQGADALAKGASQLDNGVRQLYQGTQGLKDGTEQLFDGVAELKDGTGELKDGTREFRTETGDIDGRIDEEIDKMMADYTGGDTPLHSFVDSRNQNIASLQFIIKTAAVKPAAAPAVTVTEDIPLTLWQRITQLFQ